MGLIVEHSGRSRPQVYEFQVQDQGARARTFSCVAKSVQDAFGAAREAGFHSVLLMEARDLTANESASEATRRVLAHPLLGPEWMPIVEAVELITSRLRARRFWTLNTLTAIHGYDPYSSPYVQAMREDDGSLHVELGGESQSLSTASVSQSALLELLGWNAPTEDSPDNLDGHLPNSYRVFDAGWSARAISEFFLESLVVVFGLTTDDFFSVGGDFTTKVSRMIPGLYRLTGKEIFSLKPAPDAEDEYDPNFDESAMIPEGYLGEGPAPGWEESGPAEPEPARPNVVEGTSVGTLDFRGKEIEDEDFSGKSLIGANFSQCRFKKANFSHADLSGADFSGAYFEYVDFSHATLTGALFRKASVDFGGNFSFATINNADFSEVDFWHAWFIEAELMNCVLTKARFHHCDFHAAIISGANCEGALFSHSDFAGADASEIKVEGARFDEVYGNASDFSEIDFTAASLRKCDITASQFDESIFDGMDLRGNDFAGSTFEHASGVNTNFHNAFGSDKSPVNFISASLRGAIFDGNTIYHSVFVDADLTNASFVDATLDEVDFTGSSLEGANFSGAAFEECTFDGAESDTGSNGSRGLPHDPKQHIPALEQIRHIASTVNRPELHKFVTWHHYRLVNSDGWEKAVQAVGALMSVEVIDLLRGTRLGKTYGDGPRNARRSAAEALAVRHRIASGDLKQVHYDLLTEAWAVSYGLAHPDDQYPAVTLWGPEYEFGAESRNLRYILAYVRYANNGLPGEIAKRNSPRDHLFQSALDRMNQSVKGREQMVQDLSQRVVAVTRSLTEETTRGGLAEVLGRVTTAVLLRDKLSEEDFDLLTTDWRVAGGPLEAPQIRPPLPYPTIDFTAWPP